jgi:ankyrin repeat protein
MQHLSRKSVSRLGLLGIAATLAITARPAALGAPPAVDFVRDVQPIFEQNCYDCHGSEKQMNGFRLDRRSDAMRGGTIAVITPTSAVSSRLYLRLIGTTYGRRMPVDADPLRPSEIETIRNWIDQGAPWPDAASGDTVIPPPDPAAVRAFAALRAGDAAAFLAAIREGPLSTLRGSGGATPLMTAALYGDPALVRTLLERGADPNVANDAGATALMWAAADSAKVRLLVEHGADVNARAANGRTPLIVASSFPDNQEVAAFLLDRGANPSAQAAAAVTPLTAAARQRNAALIRLLLRSGADLRRGGAGALAMALRTSCDECAGLLLPVVPADELGAAMTGGMPPLAAARLTLPVIERGASPVASNPAGYPMIVLAAASDWAPVDVVKALLARGADVNATSPLGETPLTVAERHGRTPMVDALLAAGAKDALASLPAEPTQPSPAPSARAAALRSLPLLQRADVNFLRTAGCVSCHNNSLTAETVALARARRLPVDEIVAAQQRDRIARYVDEWRERVLLMQGVAGDSDSMAPILAGLAAERHLPDEATDAMARFIRAQQEPDGRWRIFAHRPPIENGDVMLTVQALRAVRAYGAAPGRRASEAAVGRAARWLLEARPDDVLERAFLLRGLHDTGVKTAILKTRAAPIIAGQRADGGWAQRPTLGSDAYATGVVLTMLLESGAATPADPAVQRGVQFLLNRQLADGSWFVPRRALPVQPYFDAGFPHGRDQFVSTAATNWATQALLRSLTTGTAPGPARGR